METLYIDRLGETSLERLQELLVGRRISAVEEGRYAHEKLFVLDTGARLVVAANEGCGGCANGAYELVSIGDFNNAITSVKLVVRDVADTSFFELFVYAEGLSKSVLQVAGTDGEMDYGRGFSVRVKTSVQ